MARTKKDNPRQMVDGIRRTVDLKRWEAAVFTGEYDEKGKPVYEWITGDTRKEVAKLRDEIKNQINYGMYVRPSDMTLGEYLLDWLEDYKTNIESTTYELYKIYITKHINPEIGRVRLQDVIPMTLRKFYNKKLETQSSNTVRKYHSLLHNALSSAVDDKLIRENPAKDLLKKINALKKTKYKPVVVLSKEDFFKLLDAVEGTYDEIYIILGGCLGLRRGEVLGLRWRDVDFKNKTITISQTFTRFSKNIIKDPKTESSRRTIKAPSYVMDALEAYRKRQKIINLDNRICWEYLPQSYSHHFRALTQKLGLPNVRFHDLRHFAAVMLLLKGVPDKVAAEMLGHSQVATLREIYQHVIDEMKDQAANAIDEVMAQNK